MSKAILRTLFILSISAIIVSCEKGTEPFPPAQDAQKTSIELPAAGDGPLHTIALDLTPGVKTISILEVRRNATSPADLNRTLVVKIKDENAVLSDETSGEVERFPSHLYTVDPENPFDGQYWTLTFAPGETVKHIKISFDPSILLSLGKRVGFGFIIAEANTADISADHQKLAVEISAKNPWDGVYSIVGSFVHADPCLTGPFGTPTTGGPLEIQLITTGATTLKRNMFGLENTIIWNNCAGGLTYFLNVIPAYSVNPATNQVTVFHANANSTVTWMVTGPMVYNPSTKTFNLNYGYVGTPNRVIQETMTFLRPR